MEKKEGSLSLSSVFAVIISSRMFTLSNFISLLRAPLAAVFFIDNTALRLAAILLAMLSDIIDGYLARRYQFTSKFGAVLDPVMDKFFVFTALGVLFFEQKMQGWQALSMISRDLFLCLFGLYLTLIGSWKSYEMRAVRWGKVTTTLQFFLLIAVVQKITIPAPIYGALVLFGLFAFIELFLREVRKSPLA